MTLKRRQTPILRLLSGGLTGHAVNSLKSSKQAQLAAILAQERAQLFHWLPVILAFGIGGYFWLRVEPPFLVVALAAISLCGAALATPRETIWRMALGIFAIISSGAALAQFRSLSVEAPILAAEHGPARVTGILRSIDGDVSGVVRLIIDIEAIEGLESSQLPRRARVTVRTAVDENLLPGDKVNLLATLAPPPPPAIPGGFDFARQAFFQKIGAAGYALSPVVKLTESQAQGFATGLRRLRQEMARRIVAQLPGDKGAVAAALITGERGWLSEEIEGNLRDAGLAHLLAISGLHIALVAGGLFFAVRLILAAIPYCALHWPVKSIAAIFGIASAFGYLLLSGMTLPTQRAFIMAGIVFVAILIGRRALTLRLTALAALIILALRPEALLSVSFQMSFAAVVALISAYEAWYRFRQKRVKNGPPTWLGRIGAYLAAVAFSTLIAEAAIGPIAMYHFNRMTLFGLAANMVAVPIVGLWVMPMGVLAVLLMPLGLEAPVLWMMGEGIGIVLATADHIANAPGAVMLLPAMPELSFLLIVIGGLWLCLWRSRLRFGAGVFFFLALLPMMWAERPDILIADSGRPVALRHDNGGLIFSTLAGRRFARETWLRREGEEKAIPWREDRAWREQHQTICDRQGCALNLSFSKNDTTLRLALPHNIAALEEDCRLADIIMTPLMVGDHCTQPMLVIDGRELARYGSHAVYFSGENGQKPFRVVTVAALRGDRPWSRLGGEKIRRVGEESINESEPAAWRATEF